MSDFVIKISGERLQYFDNVAFSSNIDSIASTLSFESFFDIADYEFAEIKAYRGSKLLFTGQVIGKDSPNESKPKPFTYRCYSKTGILEDCSIPLSGYPIQTKDKNLKEIVNSIVGYFDVILKIDATATSLVNEKYTLQDQSPDKSAKDVINSLCAQKDLVLSHNANGELIITKSIIGSVANPPTELKKNKAFNYRAFFNTYLVIGQQGILNDTARQATSIQDNIETNRITTKIQQDGDAGASQSLADSMRNDSYKSNSLRAEYNDYLANVGELFIIDNVKLMCNSVSYNLKAGSESCSISLLNSKVYER